MSDTNVVRLNTLSLFWLANKEDEQLTFEKELVNEWSPPAFAKAGKVEVKRVMHRFGRE